MNHWVIDFEASGLTRSSYPIEVGITNGVINYSSLIKPMIHWSHWNEEAESIHRITLDSIRSNGKDPLQVAIDMNSFLNTSIIYCDNIHWDRFWLNVLFSDNGLSPTFKILDIQDIIKTDLQLQRYEIKRNELYQSCVFQKHRALDDAKSIHAALMHSLAGE